MNRVTTVKYRWRRWSRQAAATTTNEHMSSFLHHHPISRGILIKFITQLTQSNLLIDMRHQIEWGYIDLGYRKLFNFEFIIPIVVTLLYKLKLLSHIYWLSSNCFNNFSFFYYEELLPSLLLLIIRNSSIFIICLVPNFFLEFRLIASNVLTYWTFLQT